MPLASTQPLTAFAFYAVTASGPKRVEIPRDKQTVDEVYALLSLGVYSALRTFDHRKFLDLARHIERTRQSIQARRAGR